MNALLASLLLLTAFHPAPSALASGFRSAGIYIVRFDSMSVDTLSNHLQSSMALCSVRNEIRLMENETKLIKGEKIDARAVINAMNACQDSAVTRGDSLFRQLRDGTKGDRKLEILKDTYAYWRASMRELAPQIGEFSNTTLNRYGRRIQILQAELTRRIERLKLEYL